MISETVPAEPVIDYTALNGATVAPISRYGDRLNRISLGTAGVFLAKDLFKESMPYSTTYVDGVKYLFMNLHFLSEVRRHLAGEQTEATSTFSPAELELYNALVDKASDISILDRLEEPVTVLDAWLVDEIMGLPHNPLTRDYEVTHKWRKTENYVYTPADGIKWR